MTWPILGLVLKLGSIRESCALKLIYFHGTWLKQTSYTNTWDKIVLYKLD